MSLPQAKALYSGPVFLKDRGPAIFLAVAYCQWMVPWELAAQ